MSNRVVRGTLSEFWQKQIRRSKTSEGLKLLLAPEFFRPSYGPVYDVNIFKNMYRNLFKSSLIQIIIFYRFCQIDLDQLVRVLVEFLIKLSRKVQGLIKTRINFAHAYLSRRTLHASKVGKLESNMKVYSVFPLFPIRLKLMCQDGSKATTWSQI